MKRLLLSIITVFAAGTAAFADGEVSFEALAPGAVNAGEVFRIEFVINTKPSEFSLPPIDGFEVLAGPSQSHSTNVSIVNGEVSRVTTITYTYVLQGFTPGLHTIPAATAKVKGQTYSSRPINIEVVATDDSTPANSPSGTPQAAQGGQQQQSAGSGNEPAVAKEDLFARVIVSKNNVYKGEPIHVSFKVYSRGLAVSQFLEPKIASFNGFWSQDLSSSVKQQRETYNNRVYDTWTLWEYLIYPQQSGSLTIDPFEISVALQYRVSGGSRNLFDDFFGTNIQEVRKRVASSPVRIDVKEWPSGAPSSFNGAVGQFTMEATPPQSNMNANSSGTYTVKISGTGNFPMIRAPKMELPTSFEEYTVTTSESTRHTAGGTIGYRQFSYPFIPRMEGSYAVPEFRFSYFDPGQSRYITLSSREVPIEVAADSTSVSSAGVVSGFSKEDLKILGRDIRFIKIDSPNLRPKGRIFMWSPIWFSLMALLAVMFATGLVVLKRYVRNMQNDKFVRGKRANKVALKRFRAAETSMRQGDKQGFYDEMLKALWGYMSDKLDIPMSALNKDRIREELFERNVTGEKADDYVKIISACEEAQYSPTSSSQMNELYKEGVNLVSELESAIKK